MTAVTRQDRVDILGYQVSHVRDMEDALGMAEAMIAEGGFHHIVLGNIFTAIQSRHDPLYRQIANSSALTIADGISLVWASRWLGDPVGDKIFGWDLFDALTGRAAEKGYTIMLVGGGPGGAALVAEALQAKYPSLRILGAYSPALGPIDEVENDKIVALVNAASPDICWTGLGSPLQETWLWRNRERLDTRVAVGVGSAFDHVMGRQERMPHWMDRMGLGWLHRVTQDPSVLWRKRYDRYFPQFVFPVLWLAAKKRVARARGRAIE